VTTNLAGLPKNAQGCPILTTAPMGGQAGTLQAMLTTPRTPGQGGCPAGQIDCFANFNVNAIVLQVDKSLLNSGTQTLTSVWGSTHATP
jgi:hypothetical protein